ncbi:hypothetical protein FP026_25600 [Rhizobium tropici]|uniref:Uncharacterized protein n=1 Tax=Rhizobium tropici TaxID=398 RepID=A0A5B0VU63_RHITR|nr:hypothetical protein [Rhizobium tropici]KAA1177269.1 hypothetical protein FP026_25600 [Rhizobium tropici]
MFTLHTFGHLRLTNKLGYVSFPDKGLLAICYLLDTKQFEASRTDIATLLWSGEDRAGLLANMRQTIARVKSCQRELGVDFLTFTPTTIRVEVEALTSDLSLLDIAEDEEPLQALYRVAEAMKGDFLEGFEPIDTLLDLWVKQKRGAFSNLLLRVFKRALTTISATESDMAIRKVALQIFRLHPHDEEVQRFLLESGVHDGALDGTTLPLVGDARVVLSDAETEPLPLQLASRMFNKQFAQARDSLLARPLPIAPPYGGRKLDVPRLALLPPQNDSESIVATLVAASLIEDITIGFCSLKSVRVIAPHTARQFSRDPNKAAVFERHGISYILDTRISYAQEVSLFAQLVFFANDEIIWAERFSLDSSNLTLHRRELSKRIALIVASHIERDSLSRAYYEASPDAYHSYLVGQRHLKELTLPNLRRARREFRTALQKNPHFAPALSGLARTYTKEWLLTMRGDEQLLASAAEFSTKAISVGEDLAGGYRERGIVKLAQGDIDESVNALNLAETLSPHYADIIADYADTLVHASRPADALEKIANAIDLNPLTPDTYLWTAAGASYCLYQFETALSYIAMMHDSGLADRLSAACWAMLGDMKKARSFVRNVRASIPDFDVDKWLSMIVMKEQWQKDLYREGLRKAGF